MVPPHSFLVFLILSVLHTSHIFIPVNSSFLGVGVGNITCTTDIHQWRFSSQPELPMVSQLHEATLSCGSSFKFFGYKGSLHFSTNATKSNAVLVNTDFFGTPPPKTSSETSPLQRSPSFFVGDERQTESSRSPPHVADDRPFLQHGIRRENPIELRLCNATVTVTDLHVFPPDPFLDVLSETLTDFLNVHLEDGICSYLVPFFGNYLGPSNSLLPRALPKEKVAGATSLVDSSLFRSLVHLIHALPPPLSGTTLRATFIGDTSLRLFYVFDKGLGVSYHSGDEKAWDVFRTLASAAAKHISALLSRLGALNGGELQNMKTRDNDFSPSFLLSIIAPEMSFLWAPDTVLDLLFHASLPPHSSVSMDVNVEGFYWDEDTYACSISQKSGITISNWRIEDAGELGDTLTNVVLPALTDHINRVIDKFLQSLPSVTMPSFTPSDLESTELSGKEEKMRFVAIPITKPVIQDTPSGYVLVVYGVLSLIVCIGVVLRGLWLHSCNAILSKDTMEPVSRLQVFVEDLLLSLGVCLCVGCFVWSNCTTAATVVVGKDLIVYRFSLRSTVADLWAAGLSPLALTVALFSGVYPYVKLISILYFTSWKCIPRGFILHVIDCLGKFSLLDTFVMLIMVSGLTVHNVVDVHVLPPFYIFLAGTIGCIVMGNYGNRCWRRNAILHKGKVVEFAQDVLETEAVEECPQCCQSVSSSRFSRSNSPSESPEEEENSSAGGNELDDLNISSSTVKGHLFRRCSIKRFFCALLASTPAWIFPLVSYRVGGVGPLLTNEVKTFNLFQLCSSVDRFCLAVTLFTVLIAPCLYATAPYRLSWLSSWCAADALVLSCLAGLLQLNQFIEFIVGEDLKGVYTVHATLHSSFVPLFLAALHVWWLVLADMSHFKGFKKRWRRIQKKITEYREGSVDAEENADLLFSAALPLE